MNELVLAAESAYFSAPEDLPVVPSIPILYFGNLERYRASKLRVITVALNPSYVEFPSQSPFERFPKAANLLTMQPAAARVEMTQHALNEYFAIAPYRDWFSANEHVLNGFSASYYGLSANTALHTDLLSPVATKRTWSDLSKLERRELSAPGMKIWHNLVTELRPHVVLVSVARSHLDRLSFRLISPWSIRLLLPAKPQFPVHAAVLETWPGGASDFVFARAAQVPFGFFKDSEKRAIGPGLRGRLSNW